MTHDELLPQKELTSRAARADVQQWRARSSAILTGSGTVLADDPQLTVRLAEGVEVVPPMRVVLDTRGRLSAGKRIFDSTAATIAVHAIDMVPDYADEISAFAVPRDGDDGLDLHATLSQLAQRDINEVQVEAGATLCGALLRDGLVDELLLYLAPVLLGDKGRPLFAGMGINLMADRIGLDIVDQRMVGPDLRLLLRRGRGLAVAQFVRRMRQGGVA